MSTLLPLLVAVGLCMVFYWCGWMDAKRHFTRTLLIKVARRDAKINMLINSAKQYLAGNTAGARDDLVGTIEIAEKCHE